MTSKSRVKGNSFEYAIVKLLNKTYETTEFARTPGSGAYMGRKNWTTKQGLAEGVKGTLSSDIIVPSWFKFSIECKSYRDRPNYATLIRGPESTLDQWIEQTNFDAKKLNLWPLLFFKTNNCGTFAVLRKVFCDVCDLECFVIYRRLYLIIGMDTFFNNSKAIKHYAIEYACW